MTGGRLAFSAPMRDGVSQLEFVDDGLRDCWRRTTDQWYLWRGNRFYAPCVIPLPLGGRTDGPSIPLIAQHLVPREGDAWIPAEVHDTACMGELFPVQVCNDIMVDAMHDYGTDEDRMRLIEPAIRGFCWITFLRHDDDVVAADRALIIAASRRIWRQHGAEFAGYGRIEDISPVLIQ